MLAIESIPPTDVSRLSPGDAALRHASDVASCLTKGTDIREAILCFLKGFRISYPRPVVVTPDFFAACCKRAQTYGFPLSGQLDLRRALQVGTAIACAAYPHIDENRRIFTAVLTAAMVMLDDRSTRMDGCSGFTARIVLGLSQDDPILDGLVCLLQDTGSYSGPILADLTLANTLNFFAAITLEELGRTMSVHPQAAYYASYKRYLSGLADFYTFMIFPSTIPLEAYVQATPEISKLTCVVNDVLSFYKEEVAGETGNLISDMANAAGTTRLEALNQLTNECIDLHNKVIAILGEATPACKAYETYMVGYVQFHASIPRYRLEELDIPVGAPFAD